MNRIERLREYHTPTEIPPCRICGRPLTIQAIGGGKPTVWGCSEWDENGERVPGRRCADQHYGDSKFEDHKHSDSDVRALLDLVEVQHEALESWITTTGADECSGMTVSALAAYDKFQGGDDD